MRLFYNLFLYLYNFAIFLASPFYSKAALWRKGRVGIFPKLKAACSGKKIIWLHCASLGEYEQGKPLIEKWRAEKSDFKILVTFFSPSGYEVRKNDATADFVFYLPLDTPRQVKRFLDAVQPKTAVFVKYEYWYNYMKELHLRKIPFYYVSAIFFPHQHFFKWYGGWFRKQLALATHFYVQDKNSETLLQSVGINQVTIIGDTRFDRVCRIAKDNVAVPEIEEFKASSKLLVAGSTWPPDEKLLASLYPSICDEYKVVIAPHLIDKEHINSIKRFFAGRKTILYSEKEGKSLAEYEIFIIDTIGLLNKIYKYADVAHIGGGFETGLHNTLEAAVFGIPVFFGPHYSKFNEAVQLVVRRAGFPVHSLDEMRKVWLEYVENKEFYSQTCANCRDYVMENMGATEKVIIDVAD